MKNWKSLEHAAQCAKTEKEKRRAYFAIRIYLADASRSKLPELKKIVETTDDEFIREHTETELWWRKFDKTPENLLELIRTSNDKNKISKAITELGDLKCKDAVRTLFGFLNDVDLRDAAAMALRAMPTQKAFEPLVQAIKQHPDGAECLLYALEVIDCSDAAELLVDLFISGPDAPLVRCDIFVCFSEKAVKRISKQVKKKCCSKLQRAIEKSKNQDDIEELRQLYDIVLQIKES